MKKALLVFFASLIFLIGCQPLTLLSQEGKVAGVIGVVFGDGMVRPGARMKVCLVTKSFPILYKEGWNVGGIYPREEALFKSYMEFCKRVEKEKVTNLDYLASETTSNLSGQFEFERVKAGEYFILVGFPSAVGNNKMIWQVPVVVVVGKTTKVELSNDNLAMPSLYLED